MKNLYLACCELTKKVLTSCLLFAFVMQSCCIDSVSKNNMMSSADTAIIRGGGEVWNDNASAIMAENDFTSMDMVRSSNSVNNSLKEHPTSNLLLNLFKIAGIFVVGRAIEFALVEGYKSFENGTSLIPSTNETSNQFEFGNERLLQTGNTCSCTALSTCTTNLLAATISLSSMTSAYNNCTTRLTNATNNFNSVNNTLSQTSTWLASNVSALSACQGSLSTCNNNLSGNNSLLVSCNNYLDANNSLLASCNTDLSANNNLLATCQSSLGSSSTSSSNCDITLNGDGTWANPGYRGLVDGYIIGGQSVAGYSTNYTSCNSALNGVTGCIANLTQCNNLYTNQTVAFNNITSAFANQSSQLSSCIFTLSTSGSNVMAQSECNNALYGYQMTPHNIYDYVPGCYDLVYGNISAGISGDEALYGQLDGSTYTPGCLDSLKGYYSANVNPTQQYGCDSILNGNSSTAGGLPGIIGYISQWSALMFDQYGDGSATNPGCYNSLNGNNTLTGGNVEGALTQINSFIALLYGVTDVNGNYDPGYMGELYGYTDSNSVFIPGCYDYLNGNSAELVPAYLAKLRDICEYTTLDSTSTPFCTTQYGGSCTTCTDTCSTALGVTTCTACTGCTVSSLNSGDFASADRTIVSTASGSTCSNCVLNSGSSVSGSCDTCTSYIV